MDTMDANEQNCATLTKHRFRLLPAMITSTPTHRYILAHAQRICQNKPQVNNKKQKTYDVREGVRNWSKSAMHQFYTDIPKYFKFTVKNFAEIFRKFRGLKSEVKS